MKVLQYLKRGIPYSTWRSRIDEELVREIINRQTVVLPNLEAHRESIRLRFRFLFTGGAEGF